MPLPLADLLAGATTDETLATLVALAAVAGFPAYAWQAGSVPRTFFELESISYSDLTQVIGAIAGGGFVDYAEGPWLTLRAAQGYNLQRRPAVYTQGTILLTDAGGIGPVDVTEQGQILIESGGTRYRNVSLGTLPASGTVALTFEAELSGSAGNLPDGATFSLVTSLPGVTAEQVTPPGGTWISQQGSNEESDPTLRERCKSRWGELGHGATEAAYRFWATAASNQVTRTAVKEATGDGTVVVYVAGPAGPIDAGEVTAITTYLNDPVRRVQCVRPSAQNASLVTVVLTGTVKVKAAQLAAAQADAAARLVALFAEIPLGGLVYRGPIEAAIMAIPGVVNAALSNAAEQQLGAAQVPVVNLSGLTWIGV